MRRLRIPTLSLLFALFLALPAFAQTNTTVNWINASNKPVQTSAANPLPISGSFSATGFTPNGSYGTLTATASTSASTALPTGTTVRITNTSLTGAVVSCTFATGAATGLVSNLIIAPLSSVSRVVGSYDHIACIDQTGSTGSNVVVLEGGSGLGNDSGGGGGGGGGAVTIADGADVNSGATTDAAATAGGTGTLSAKLRLMTTQLDTLNTNVTSAIPAGTNIIGKVGIDQTTDGTTNGVRQTTQYPSGAVAETASATGTTAATTATLATNTGQTTFICGFSIRANATAAATGNATVTGTVTGTLNFTQWTAPNASGLGVTEMIFTPCVPASTTNTAIAVVSAAPGTGGVVSVSAWGYLK